MRQHCFVMPKGMQKGAGASSSLGVPKTAKVMPARRRHRLSRRQAVQSPTADLIRQIGPRLLKVLQSHPERLARTWRAQVARRRLL
jgi:hypothetical protein